MIRLYWKNATAEVVGAADGVTAADLDGISPKVEAALETVRRQADAGELGYLKLPGRTDYRDQVMKLVEVHRPAATDLVVLGIGGSALGNIALQAALNPATYNLMDQASRGGPRLFVLDNVDPALVADVIGCLGDRLETTLFNVISKSGETAETASQFMIFRELLQKALGDDYARRVVATTDAAKGTLHTIATAEGYDMLEVPGDVGGRFSVLSEVGLFSAAMCGIDIDAVLGGAGAMADRCRKADWRANPAGILAAVKYLMMTAKGKPIHVMMPYSNRLYSLADWYRQLWAESLGKKHNRAGEEVFVGPTPVKALGATDQHSQVQLYREGPPDKLTVFVGVAEHPADVDIPDAFGDVPGLAYLGGATLGELLSAEMAATEYALAQAHRPSVTIRFDAITPAAVGEFIMLYELTTSLMGELLEINAYDQPAVELGKQATFGLLGRDGFEDLGSEVRAFTATDERYVL